MQPTNSVSGSIRLPVSSDPVVLAAILRYGEVEQERTRLDEEARRLSGFLAAYQDVAVHLSGGAQVGFADTIKALLREHGAPMSAQVLYDVMQQRHPAWIENTKFESFERKLSKLPMFERTKDRCYKLIDGGVAVPALTTGVLNGNPVGRPEPAATDFARTIRGILIDHGKPMSKHDLAVAYQKACPDNTLDIDSLSRKLRRVRDVVANLNDGKAKGRQRSADYWVVDVPVPGAARAVRTPAKTRSADDDGEETEGDPAPVAVTELAPLAHFEVTDGACGCGLCATWRDWRTQLNRLQSQVEGHVQECDCLSCHRRNRAAAAFTAAGNRVDFWSEMSFHAADHPDLGKKGLGLPLMEWAGKELEDDGKSSGFWEKTIERYSVNWWLTRYRLWRKETTATAGPTGLHGEHFAAVLAS